MRSFAKIGDKPSVSATALLERLDHIVIIGPVIKIIFILYESDGQVPKPVTNRLSTPREEEALIYLGIGATVAFLLSAGTLVRKII